MEKYTKVGILIDAFEEKIHVSTKRKQVIDNIIKTI